MYRTNDLYLAISLDPQKNPLSRTLLPLHSAGETAVVMVQLAEIPGLVKYWTQTQTACLWVCALPKYNVCFCYSFGLQFSFFFFFFFFKDVVDLWELLLGNQKNYKATSSQTFSEVSENFSCCCFTWERMWPRRHWNSAWGLRRWLHSRCSMHSVQSWEVIFNATCQSGMLKDP